MSKERLGFYHWYYIMGLRFCNLVCNVRYSVEGFEKIPAEGPLLVVMNHASRFDPMLACLILRNRKMVCISKPENFKIPIAGWAIRKNRFIPIDRSSAAAALPAINQAISMAKEEGYSIGVCPEGTRNDVPYPLIPFKAGCFKVAQRANIPVLMMAMHGTDKIGRNAPWRRTNVKVEVLGTLNPSDFQNTRELSAFAEKIISEAVERRLYL